MLPERMYHSAVFPEPPKPALATIPPHCRRSPRALLFAGVPSILVLGGCDPIFDVGGAFFPAWLLAAVIGLVVTILVRAGLVHWGIDRRLFGGGFAYIGLFICLSILTWLWFFRT